MKRSLSLPLIQPLYIVGTSFHSNNTKQEVAIGSLKKLTEIRMGIWGACYHSRNKSDCYKATSPYGVAVTENKSRIAIVDPSLSRGLALQVFAGGCTLLAFISALFAPDKYHRRVTLIITILAGGMSGLALFMELALLMTVQDKMGKLGAGAKTNPGPGLWMTLIPTLFLGAASFWLYMDKSRIEKMDNKEYQVDEKEDMEQEDLNHSGHGPGKFRGNAGRGPFSPTFTPLLSVPQSLQDPQKTQPQQLPPPGQGLPQGQKGDMTQVNSNHSTGNVQFPGNVGQGPLSSTFTPLLSASRNLHEPQMPQAQSQQWPLQGQGTPQGPPQTQTQVISNHSTGHVNFPGNADRGPPQGQGQPQTQTQVDSNHSAGHVNFPGNAGMGTFSPTFTPLLSVPPSLHDPQTPQPQQWPPQGPPQTQASPQQPPPPYDLNQTISTGPGPGSHPFHSSQSRTNS